MTYKEYFGDWTKVLDKSETIKIMKWLKTIDTTTLCPAPKNIFKAFKLCPYNDCRCVWIGQDPYPQKGVAQGLLFANSKDTLEDKISPSLQVIKEAILGEDWTNKVFDNTMEYIAEQGVLLINSSLTCKVNNVGIHSSIWHEFTKRFVHNFSINNPGIVWLLFGSQAISFKDYIVGKNILTEYHPAYYARQNIKMPRDIFNNANKILRGQNGYGIRYYEEINNYTNAIL